jgi:hypothetical protein
MLDYPKLCLDYIYLVSLLVDYFPDRLSQLPQNLLSGLLESLLFGMQQSVGRISDYSFKAVQSLGLFNWSEIVNGTILPLTERSHQLEFHDFRSGSTLDSNHAIPSFQTTGP